MDTLFTCLRSLSNQRFGTIVHIGASDARVLQGYAELDARHVILIEGDPEIGTELQRRATTQARVTVRVQVVAPQEGAITWNRYNLPSLNGPVDVHGLADYYPRLRRLDISTQPAVSLRSMLADIPLAGGSECANALILDVPGQEDALLASLPGDEITRFDVVLIRGCAVPLRATDGGAQGAVARLSHQSYSPAGSDRDTEPLWPVDVLKLDRLSLLRSQIDARQQQIEALSRELESLRGEVTASQHACAKADAARAQADAEAKVHTEELARQRDVQTKLANDRYLTIAALTQDKVALDTALDALRLASSEAHATHAQKESASATRIEQLVGERDELTRSSERLRQSIDDTKRHADGLESECGVLRAQVAEGASKLAELTASVSALSKQADERSASLEATLQRRESELEEFRSKLREASAKIEAIAKERDEHKHWHLENERWAQGLKAQNEQLEAVASTLRDERQAMASRLTEAEAAARRADQQLAESDARQRLLDAEIWKAEAQLDLIKDVLIREKNF